MKQITLGPTETAPGRPFTSVDLYPEDIECLRVLIADLCGVLRQSGADKREITPFEYIEWQVDGLRHRLIVCDQERLLEHEALCAVGFFSERHGDVDIAPLEEANLEVVKEFRKYPGVLSYGSIQLPGGHWANLVLHEEPDTTERWREGSVHSEAVERLSATHYKNVRIHNARLTSGLSAEPDVEIVRTKYFDYETDSDWRAVRELPAPFSA
jgi:hypothetical protein